MFDPSSGFFVLRRRKAVLLEIFLFAFFAPSAFVPRSQNYGGQDGATAFRAYTTIAKPNPNPARTFVSFVNFCKKSLSSCSFRLRRAFRLRPLFPELWRTRRRDKFLIFCKFPAPPGFTFAPLHEISFASFRSLLSIASRDGESIRGCCS